MKSNLEYKEYKILEKTELAPDIYLFKFQGKIPFMPGQFVQAALDHYGEITLAICSDPEANYFELCIRGCGSASNKIIELYPGDSLKIRGPYGKGWPIARLLGQEVTLVAGGMGIVPLRPLIFEIIRNKSEFKKINFVAGFKTSDHILFENDILSLKKTSDQLEVDVEAKTQPFWGNKGMITEALEKIKFNNPEKSTVLLCGPDIMIPYCNEILKNKKIPDQNIYVSLERRMECGIGICQHCNIGKFLVCKDGPVFRWDIIKDELEK